jgi:hypothetical protein
MSEIDEIDYNHLPNTEWRKLTLEEQKTLYPGSSVLVKRPNGSVKTARFVTGARHFAAKVIFDAETAESTVAVNSLGYSP